MGHLVSIDKEIGSFINLGYFMLSCQCDSGMMYTHVILSDTHSVPVFINTQSFFPDKNNCRSDVFLDTELKYVILQHTQAPLQPPSVVLESLHGSDHIPRGAGSCVLSTS